MATSLELLFMLMMSAELPQTYNLSLLNHLLLLLHLGLKLNLSKLELIQVSQTPSDHSWEQLSQYQKYL